MSPKILSNVYSCVVRSVLTSCITVWYGSTTVRDRKRLQRVVKTAEKIIRTPLPSLQAIYHRRVHRRTASILKDPTLKDGVKHVWRQPGEEYKDVLPKVKHGGGRVMVWGCMRAASTGELQFIEGTMNANMYYDILKQRMIPPLWGLSRRAAFQHDNDHCLAKEAKGKGDGLAKHVSRPKPYWASVGHPQTEGGGAQGLLHPPAPWCRHEVVEEDSSDNLWSSGELHTQEG